MQTLLAVIRLSGFVLFGGSQENAVCSLAVPEILDAVGVKETFACEGLLSFKFGICEKPSECRLPFTARHVTDHVMSILSATD